MTNTATAQNIQTLTDRDLFVHFATTNQDLAELDGIAYDNACDYLAQLEDEIDRRWGADATERLSNHFLEWRYSAQDIVDEAKGDHQELIKVAKDKCDAHSCSCSA